MNMSQARRRARQAAVQAIYQWQMAQTNIADIQAQFRDEHDGSKTDLEYFNRLISDVTSKLSQIDELYTPYVSIKHEDLDPIERAILRLATCELKFYLDIPYKVVINEAINLGKRYGADKSHRFINGVVDKVALDTRQLEINAQNKK